MKLLAVALLMLAGCSAADRGVDRRPLLRLDGDPTDRAELQSAADDWNRICGTDIAVSAVGVPVIETNSIVTSGLTTRYRSTIMRVEYRTDAPRAWTFRHELGHVLLIPHRDHGIMTPEESSHTITAEDCELIGTDY